MNAVGWIVAWCTCALVAGLAAGSIATRKNRSPVAWSAWCLVFPPLLLVLLLLGRGQHARVKTLREEIHRRHPDNTDVPD